ncbi:PH domain-containing protein [bacterium]|nr:PH domain-containing protein [bacterium]
MVDHKLASRSDLELMIGKDEKILWKGRPNKKCFILEGIFNPLLPFALVWGLIDSLVLVGFAGAAVASKEGGIAFIIPLIFILFHMMPVWIYLTGAILTVRKYQHTEYIVTDKGVYISGGLFSYTCEMKPFSELSRVNIHRGIIDQMIGVGDVVLTSNNVADMYGGVRKSRVFPGIRICDIPDYQNVFTLIKQLQTDIYTDTMYPNDLRPEENHGYKTKYKGLE